MVARRKTKFFGFSAGKLRCFRLVAMDFALTKSTGDRGSPLRCAATYRFYDCCEGRKQAFRAYLGFFADAYQILWKIFILGDYI